MNTCDTNKNEKKKSDTYLYHNSKHSDADWCLIQEQCEIIQKCI